METVQDLRLSTLTSSRAVVFPIKHIAIWVSVASDA
jgi:hypothetical protein